MFAAMSLVIALFAVACRAPTDTSSAPSPTSPAVASDVDPARVERVRAEMPGGYEFADVTSPIAPATLWGFGSEWTAEPPSCGVLADPVAAPASTHGWSGSGPGGIVYVVVAGSPAHTVALDPAVVADCGQWTLSGGLATGDVTRRPAPSIDGAATVAMATAVTTVVEGATETRSHTDTVSAYLGNYVAFVTVVTDPGSPNPQLGQEFATALMTKTVSALRG
jgi:hypothetical protein